MILVIVLSVHTQIVQIHCDNETRQLHTALTHTHTHTSVLLQLQRVQEAEKLFTSCTGEKATATGGEITKTPAPWDYLFCLEGLLSPRAHNCRDVALVPLLDAKSTWAVSLSALQPQGSIFKQDTPEVPLPGVST